jgi:hypothetical protein
MASEVSGRLRQGLLEEDTAEIGHQQRGPVEGGLSGLAAPQGRVDQTGIHSVHFTPVIVPEAHQETPCRSR